MRLGKGILFFAVICAVLLIAVTAEAGDWPRYRGSNHDGISPEGIGWPPVEVWRADVGDGFSQVVVSDGRVYTAGWDSNQDTVYCFDEGATGNDPTPIWTQSYSCSSTGYNGTRATPTIDGNEVYMFSHEGRLSVFNKVDGTPQWNVTVTSSSTGWGLAGSPLIDNTNNLVILNVGQEGVAIDKGGTHTQVWPATINGNAGYASPVPFVWNAQNLVAIFTGPKVTVRNPATGAEVCYFNHSATANAADPIIDGDYIFISTGYSQNNARLELVTGGAAMADDTAEEWRNSALQNKENCSVLSGGYLYGIDDGGTLRCLDWATGDTEWSQSGFGTEGSVMIAGGELVIMSGQDGGSNDGDLVIAELTNTGYNELHRQDDILTGDTWTCPTVANGKLYIRNRAGTVVCFDINVLTADIDVPSSSTHIATLGGVAFEGEATGGDETYSWSWDCNGDATEDSTLQDYTHTYSTVGQYTAELTVTDGNSDTSTDSISVIIWDDNGTSGVGNFGDDSDWDGDSLQDGWEMHYFGDFTHGGGDQDDSDPYNNELEETAGTDPTDGNSPAVITASITSPASDIVAQDTYNATLTGTTSGGIGGNAISWDYNTLDGPDDDHTTLSGSHTYNAAGRYILELNVEDDGAQTASDSVTIIVWSDGGTVGDYGDDSDADNDGLPDGWEMDFFSDLDEVASGNPDGDVYNNGNEYDRGLDPLTFDEAPKAEPSASCSITSAGDTGFVTAVFIMLLFSFLYWNRKRV